MKSARCNCLPLPLWKPWITFIFGVPGLSVKIILTLPDVMAARPIQDGQCEEPPRRPALVLFNQKRTTLSLPGVVFFTVWPHAAPHTNNDTKLALARLFLL